MAAGDRLRGQYQALSADPNSLANLDQDLPNNMQSVLPIVGLFLIHSLSVLCLTLALWAHSTLWTGAGSGARHGAAMKVWLRPRRSTCAITHVSTAERQKWMATV